MKQADSDASNTLPPAVTGEQSFFGPVHDETLRYCVYKAGVPLREALEHAHCLIGAVQGSLEELGAAEIDGTSLAQTLWSLSYVLETANAGVYAVLRSPRVNA